MNKLIIAVIIVCAVAAGFLYAHRDSSEMGETAEQQAMMAKEGNEALEIDAERAVEQRAAPSPATTTPVGESVARVGSYETYSPDKIARAATGKVVLFFRAGWCPSCRTVDMDIKKNLGEIPASLTILDVNYDESAALKAKYGVTYQHTFVQVDAQGTLLKKWSGSPTLAALVAEVR